MTAHSGQLATFAPSSTGPNRHAVRIPGPISRRDPIGLCTLVVAVVLFALPATASAVEIEEFRWGFDGQVVAGRFNVLSVLVSNPMPEQVEGKFRLQKLLGGFRPVGAVLEKSFFVAPYGSRWVQFHPFIQDNWEEFQLSWGSAEEETINLPRPRHGKRANVILVDPQNVSTLRSPLKSFPDNLFPTSVTATDSLRSVLLNRVPRWEGARRQAFLDWIFRGGTVHILLDDLGRFPTFPESLQVLNSPDVVTRHGRGRVRRHSLAIGDMDPDFIEMSIEEKATPTNRQRTRELESFLGPVFVTGYGSDETIFSTLRSMARASRNWFLIYFCSFLYLAMLFPGSYLMGRKVQDYRWVFVALIAAVSVFSLMFFTMGRRDYGEKATVRSVALAYPLADGHYDVQQWSEAVVSVAQGEHHTLKHSGTGRIYSTCQNTERVLGTITDEVDAAMVVDIPPFSSRNFVHRSRLAGPTINPVITEIVATGGQLQSLEIAFNESLQQPPQETFVVFLSNTYRMSYADGRLSLITGPSVLRSYQDEDDPYYYFDPEYNEYQTTEDGFQSLCRPLVWRSLQRDYAGKPLPIGQIRLCMFTKISNEFLLENSLFSAQSGYVLYCFDIATTGNL